MRNWGCFFDKSKLNSELIDFVETLLLIVLMNLVRLLLLKRRLITFVKRMQPALFFLEMKQLITTVLL